MNQVWSMDSMSGTLNDGRSIRTFNVIDDFNHEGLGVDIDLLLPSSRTLHRAYSSFHLTSKP